MKFLLIFVCLCTSVFGCHSSKTEYVWNKVTNNAAYPESYGFPVFSINEKMFAFHQESVWSSTDGANWTKTDLPSVRRDAYQTRYVQFNRAVYALGQNEGNYLKIRFGSTVRRTTDFKRWETLAEKSDLPNRIFHGTIVFNGKIWIIGGFDGKNYHNDIWNSADGVRWTRVVERAAWSPRNAGILVEFKNRLWMFGGGVIDGMMNVNPNSHKEIWSSADGVNWTRAGAKTEMPAFGGTPIVFDDKLWLVGANRNDGNFARSSLVTDDGVTWREEPAPWSPRGAVAVWTFKDKLFMTGGRYSYMKNGEPVFVYSNDVWAMSKKTE